MKARWQNAYRAARLGHEVALHWGPGRDSTGRYGIIVRPGGHTAWGHMGLSCGTAGQGFALWLLQIDHAKRHGWDMRTLLARGPYGSDGACAAPVLP